MWRFLAAISVCACACASMPVDETATRVVLRDGTSTVLLAIDNSFGPGCARTRGASNRFEQGQVLTCFKDLDASGPAFRAVQFFGTKGFFPDHYARPGEPLESTEAARWLKIALPDGKIPPAAAHLLRRGVRRGEFCRVIYELTSSR